MRIFSHMSSTAADAQQRPKGRRGWQPGQSGNPEGARPRKLRIAELFADMAEDFGGLDAMSAVDRALLSQACKLMVRAGGARDHDLAVRLSGEGRRLLSGLRKRAPAPKAETLREYLANRAEKPADAVSEPAA